LVHETISLHTIERSSTNDTQQANTMVTTLGAQDTGNKAFQTRDRHSKTFHHQYGNVRTHWTYSWTGLDNGCVLVMMEELTAYV